MNSFDKFCRKIFNKTEQQVIRGLIYCVIVFILYCIFYRDINTDVVLWDDLENVSLFYIISFVFYKIFFTGLFWNSDQEEWSNKITERITYLERTIEECRKRSNSQQACLDKFSEEISFEKICQIQDELKEVESSILSIREDFEKHTSDCYSIYECECGALLDPGEMEFLYEDCDYHSCPVCHQDACSRLRKRESLHNQKLVPMAKNKGW